MLSDAQIERYSRQIILPQVGGKGQEKLLHARVLVNGGGPLHTAALLYLAAAGVGTIGVAANAPPSLLPALAVDQEDPAHGVLTRLNPDCTVTVHPAEDAASPEQLVQGYDIVLSAPDRLHDTCYALRRPFICAQVSSRSAWLFSCRGYEPDQPCLRCLAPQTCGGAEGSAFAEVAAVFLGTLQTTEALKLILGLSPASGGKLWQCQFPALHFSESVVRKNPECWLCG
jgi:molybdopterin/thiamine biosynthesis adenylyltransferase